MERRQFEATRLLAVNYTLNVVLMKGVTVIAVDVIPSLLITTLVRTVVHDCTAIEGVN